MTDPDKPKLANDEKARQDAQLEEELEEGLEESFPASDPAAATQRGAPD
jgi:hypothetical protein